MSKTKKNYVYSMTGHGHCIVLYKNTKITINIFSTNHRQLDLSFSIPDDIMMMETDFRSAIKKRIRRGALLCKITFSINQDSSYAAIKNSIDLQCLKKKIKELKQISLELGIKEDLTISTLLYNFEKIQHGLSKNILTPELYSKIMAGFEKALDKMMIMKKKEGDTLVEDISNRLNSIVLNIKKIEKKSPEVVKQYRLKLLARLEEITKEIKNDEERLLKEIMFMTEKSDINEEIIRLKSHVNQFKTILLSKEPYGKKLDFMLQEMLRECSTISAKANNKDIAHLIVDCKTDIERIREQVQNIE